MFSFRGLYETRSVYLGYAEWVILLQSDVFIRIFYAFSGFCRKMNIFLKKCSDIFMELGYHEIVYKKPNDC